MKDRISELLEEVSKLSAENSPRDIIDRKSSVRGGGKRKHKKCKAKAGNPSVATAELSYGAVKQAEREAILRLNSWFYHKR